MMLAISLALAASAAYGTADFVGGIRSRTSPVLVVLLLSQGTGLVLLLAIVVSNWTAPPPGSLAAAAAVAGVGEAVAVAALYRGLAVGHMGTVASLSALSPIVPVGVAAATEAPPSPLQATGIVAAVLGLVSMSRTGASRPAAMTTSVACGLLAAGGFGVFYLGVGAASHSSVPWALVIARASSVALLLLAAAVLRSRLSVRPTELPGLVGLGLLVMAADALYAVAAARGSLGAVAVLASLYPVVTIVLARMRLRERLTARQQFGVGLCLLGVSAISAS